MGLDTVIRLDTHALVWMVAEPKRLSRAALAEIRSAQREGGIALSAI
jgi:PIN domain nuclease of toxin-antitoxin system